MRTNSSTPNCKNCQSRGLGVFCQLSEEQLKQFNKHKTGNRYKKGQIIFYEDNQPFGLYCVFEGKIKLYKEGLDGKTQILRIVGPGDILGYRSLFAEEPYHATAEVLEDATICFVDKNFFFSTLDQDSQLSRNLIRKLSQQLRIAEGLATSLAHRSSRERMAELLLRLNEAYGIEERDTQRIALELSRAEIADMIGVTQETSIRLLSEFKKNKWINVQDRRIEILDLEAIEKTANLS
ncbi:MAG: Crp/Fnr family transcriptional regulator [Deltaproteobacteria bacterium]|nr:Crp/Fnr family transcriptional regulator [Deltaproteobacteria bacterium]